MISAVSPGRPVAPPIKKQRASNTPKTDRITEEANQAIAKRRAELRTLQGQIQAVGSTTPGTNSVLAQAQLQLSAGPPKAPGFGGAVRSGASQPHRPSPTVHPSVVGGLARNRRETDIFPSVAKAAASSSSKAPPKVAPFGTPAGRPPASAAAAVAPPLGKASVARRLDVSFASNTSRSKSAPSARPPPPPPGPASRLAADDSTKKAAPEEATKQRGFVGRPTPVSPPLAGPARLPAKEGSDAPALPNKAVAVSSTKPDAKKSAPPDLKTTSTIRPPVATPGAKTEGHMASTPAPTDLSKDHTSASRPPVTTPGTKTEAQMSTTPPPTDLSKHHEDKPPSESRKESNQSALVVPKVNASMASTPHPAKSSREDPAPQGMARRDLVHIMRECADTPETSREPPRTQEVNVGEGNKTTAELRMQKQILELNNEKTVYMRKIADLEKEMEQMQEKNHNQSGQALQAVVQLAESSGEEADVKFAREQLGNDRQVGFLSPMTSLIATPGGGAASPLSVTQTPVRRRRTATPHPKKKQLSDEDDRNESDDEFLAMAADCAFWEYDYEDWATLIIRRPYGLASERELWYAAGNLPNKQYEDSFNVHDPSTLEVVAKIHADGSILALHGKAVVRHQVPEGEGEWKDHGNVGERDRLGMVLYIDSEANEREYSLDEIVEGALDCRNYYCNSILSTAAGLHRQKKIAPPPTPPAPVVVVQEPPAQMSPPPVVVEQPPPPKKPEVAHIGVGTEDLVYPEPKESEKKKEEPKKKPEKEKLKKPDPEEDSSDVLSVFMGMFFNLIFGILWAVIQIPFKILYNAIILVGAILAVSLLWLYLADDHGAELMGATMPYSYNSPGIV